jgi:hypothetical protein
MMEIALEIRKVANGYFVRPVYGRMMDRGYIEEKNIYVFETFERMMAWLKENFERENDRT